MTQTVISRCPCSKSGTSRRRGVCQWSLIMHCHRDYRFVQFVPCGHDTFLWFSDVPAWRAVCTSQWNRWHHRPRNSQILENPHSRSRRPLYSNVCPPVTVKIDLWPLTFEHDLDSMKMSQQVKIYVKGHFVQKLLLGHTDRHTYHTDCSTWTTK